MHKEIMIIRPKKCIIPLIMALLFFTLSLSAAPEKAGQVICRVDPGEFRIEEDDGDHRIRLDGFGNLNVPGKPRLPARIFAVAIPPGARPIGVRVEGGEAVDLGGPFRIGPCPGPRIIGEEDPAWREKQDALWRTNHEAVYGGDDPYPAEPGTFVRRAGFRRYNLVDVRVSPFRYHPRSGRLYYFPSLTIHVDYILPVEIGTPPAMPDDLPGMARAAREIILNHEEARAWYPPAPEGSRGLYDFVIITGEDRVSAVAPLVDHETLKGRHPTVVTLEWIDANYTAYDRAARIRAFLREMYPASAWGIHDVLLVGYYTELPMRECWVNVGYGRPYTDFYYAELSEADEDSWDLDGDHHYGEDRFDEVDLYSEVNVSRIPWSDPAVVEQICLKSVAFELNDDPAFKQNFLALGAFWYEDSDAAQTMEVILSMPSLSGWTATRMYEDNTDYQSAFTYDYPLTRENVVNIWSANAFSFANWGGHGSPFSCHILGEGAPPFIHADDAGLLNDDTPAIIWSIACQQTAAHYENIGRALLRQGAVGFVGCDNVAMGPLDWDEPEDGGADSCDYYFTAKVTSGEMSQGEAHQWSLRHNYVMGYWSDDYFEMFSWNILGNPDLWLGEMPTRSEPFVTGPGPGLDNPPRVYVFDTADITQPEAEIEAYGIDRFGVNVALGDIDGDDAAEVVTGPGPGAIFGPHVRAFERSGGPIEAVNFMAYGTRKFGVNVALGDVDGDGIREIVTGAGPGAVFGPHVRCFNYDGEQIWNIVGISFFAYNTRRWGVNVACGDADGDGFDEIITGAGPGAIFGPHVRGWNYDNQTVTPLYTINFFAYQSKHFGVQVAAGDMAPGSGRAEIVTGPGPGAMLGPNVRAFSYASETVSWIQDVNFMAYPGAGYGVNVAVGDTDGAGKNEILTGPGPGADHEAHVRAWRFDGLEVTPVPELDFYAYSEPALRYGVKVGINK